MCQDATAAIQVTGDVAQTKVLVVVGVVRSCVIVCV